MSLFDRLFRRGRGGTASRRPGSGDPSAPLYTTTPVHSHGGGGRAEDGERGEDRDRREADERADAGGRGEGPIEPSAQQIQVGGDASDGAGSSQQIDVGDPGGGDAGGDAGGGDSGGGDFGGDSGGGDGGGGGGE